MNSLERYTCTWKKNIKIDLRNGIEINYSRDQIVSLCATEYDSREYLDQPGNYQLFKKDPVKCTKNKTLLLLANANSNSLSPSWSPTITAWIEYHQTDGSNKQNGW